jgi:GH15 family glucan-1,4-alpha-glucosidase
MGYVDEPKRFFEFMKRGLHPSGYLMHKYRADGALGSSWHPYIHDGVVAPPIQEDETAGVLFVFAQFYQQHSDAGLLDEFYESMVLPMANFMTDYVDETTGLPKPSYDLWEEVYLTTTYTTALTHAALLAAADLADAASDADSAVRWRAAAGDIAVAAKKHLFNKQRNAFYKGLVVRGGEIEYNETVDSSSLYGVFMYGLFPLDSEEVKAAVATHETTFGITAETPGVPRYEQDNYYRSDPGIQGNWWLIASLWLAQYYQMVDQPERVNAILGWVKDRSEATGVMPEQINPKDNSFISVAPLTWSHAEYLSTLLDTI